LDDVILAALILTAVLTIAVRLAAQSSTGAITSFDASGAGKTAGSGEGSFLTAKCGAQDRRKCPDSAARSIAGVESKSVLVWRREN
jgi:hypothetical protein